MSVKEIKRWPIKEAAPGSPAVAPKHNVAFYCNDGAIRSLDLNSCKQTLCDFGTTKVVSDSRQINVYAFQTPKSKSNETHGQILVRGRPIFFTIRDDDFDWAQSTLFRFLICDGKLLLSQLRVNAASNARNLQVSTDGTVVALVGGGGGWRPDDKASGSGYGVPFLNASDFSNVLRFVETDAYPQMSAISPFNHLFLLVVANRLSHTSSMMI